MINVKRRTYEIIMSMQTDARFFPRYHRLNEKLSILLQYVRQNMTWLRLDHKLSYKVNALIVRIIIVPDRIINFFFIYDK